MRAESSAASRRFPNRERTAINALASGEWRSIGRLDGSDHLLGTIDEPTPYAIGDRVVTRETSREAGLFRGSIGVVRGIDGKALLVERRDGEIILLGTREHPGVQHAYCLTDTASRGRRATGNCGS